MEFVLTATDRGAPSQLSSTITVRVIVGDVNDNNPQFVGSPAANLKENVSPGYNVMTVQATDKDKGEYTSLAPLLFFAPVSGIMSLLTLFRAKLKMV